MHNTIIRSFRPLSSFKSTPIFTRHIHSTLPKMSAQSVPSGQDISSVAKQEGGPQQGSESAQMQSEVGKTRNFEKAAQDVMQKMQTDPSSVTPEDANYLKSREARAIGQAQPPKDSISADAQRLASANARGVAPNSGPLDPQEQSNVTKERNFEDAVNKVGQKMASEPENVTKQDGDLLHSREQRAHGHTEKGGIAAQAQHLASENASKNSN